MKRYLWTWPFVVALIGWPTLCGLLGLHLAVGFFGGIAIGLVSARWAFAIRDGA